MTVTLGPPVVCAGLTLRAIVETDVRGVCRTPVLGFVASRAPLGVIVEDSGARQVHWLGKPLPERTLAALLNAD